MSPKVLLGTVVLGIILVFSGYFVISPRAGEAPSDGASAGPVPVQEENDSWETEEPGESEETESEEVSEDVPEISAPEETTAKPEAVPVQETAVTPEPAKYTAAEVAKHGNAASCWTIIRGNVYDLTEWVSKHPGGEKNILKLCGKDGTSLFEGKHGGDSKPQAALGGFLLGALGG